MYLMDDETEKELKSVTILLNKAELHDLIGSASQLLEDPTSDHHHVSSEDYQKEITICFFDPKKIEGYCPSIQKLIRDEE